MTAIFFSLLFQFALHEQLSAEEKSGTPVKSRVIVENTHDDYVNAIIFSPDGKSVFTASRDKTVKIWDITGAKQQRSLNQGENANGIVFTPDGKAFAVGTDNGILIWDHYNNDKPLKSLKSLSGSIEQVAFSPDGKVVLGGGLLRFVQVKGKGHNTTLEAWRLPEGKKILRSASHGNSVFSVAYDPQGKSFASGAGTSMVKGSGDSSIHIWNAQPKRQIQRLKGHESRVYGLRFSPDGKSIASVGWGREEGYRLRVWKLGRKTPLQDVKISSPWCFSADGSFLASVSAFHETCEIWDTFSAKKVKTLKGSFRNTTHIAITNDGNMVATVARSPRRLSVHTYSSE